MSNKKRDPRRKEKSNASVPNPVTARWVELLASGACRTARAEAAEALKDPSASDAEKIAAREVLTRTSIDGWTLAAGLACAAVLALIIVRVLL